MGEILKMFVGVTLAGMAVAPGSLMAEDSAVPEMTPQEMAQEIRELKARLARVESREKLPTEAEVNATVERVMRDAESRGHLFSDGDFSINYTDGRLVIANADKSFLFHPWVQAQFRNTVNWRDGAKPDGSDDIQNGFEYRRLRLGIDGTIFTDFSYYFAASAQRGNSRGTVTNSSGATIGSTTNQLGGVPIVDEAWIKYHIPESPWTVRGGQFHDPLGHESGVSSKYRTFETSLTSDFFANGDAFTQGVSLIYDPQNDFRFETAFTDGIRSANTNFQDYPYNGVNYDFGVAGRVEYKAYGNWKDYTQLTALGNKTDLLVFGLGNDFSQGGDTNTWTHTIDVQYARPSGLMLFGAAYGRYITSNPGIAVPSPISGPIIPAGVPGQDTYEYAAMGQVGYLLAKRWEPYFRYEYLWVQGTPAGSENAIDDFTIGLNYYMFGHNAKISTRLMYLPNGIPVDDTGHDILSNSGKAELIFSTQLQLML